MIYTILWVIFGFLLLIILLPINLIAWIFADRSETSGPCPFTAAIIQPYVKLMAKLAGMKIDLSGQENLPEGTAFFAANHQGNFDAVIAITCLGPIKVIMLKNQLMSVPIANLYMKMLQFIPIDREDIRSSLESLKKVKVKLDAGHSVIIFPEGTRSRGPQIGEFKPGAFKAAMKAKVPVVPVTIDGTYKCFEEKGGCRKGEVKVSILPPIPCEEYEQLTTQELSELVKSKIQAELDRLRAV